MKFDLAKIRRGVRNVLIAVAALVLLRFAWDIKLLVGDNVPVPGIWTSPCAIHSRMGYAPLPNMAGSEIGVPLGHSMFQCAYTILNHNLVYWSSMDKSVCIADSAGNIRWISAKLWITDGADVCSIFASDQYIYLNIRSQNGPLRTLRLVPKTAQISVVPGVVEIRAHDNTPDVVGLGKDGLLRFYTENLVATSHPIFVGNVDEWDGDAAAKMVCWRTGHHIKTWDNGLTSGFDVDTESYHGLSLNTARRVIWISSETDFLFFWDGSVMDYHYDGAYLGTHVVTGSPIGTPMYTYDPVVADTAHRLSIIGNGK